MTQTSEKVTLKYMNTDDLVPYIYNPRDNEQAVEAVAESIRNFGFKVPIIIDAVGEIVTGHTRLKAAKRLGIKKVPVIIADDLDEDQVRAFRLADNKVGELAEWDDALLMAELAAIDLDMEQFGFDVDDLLDEAEDLLTDDEEVEEDEAIRKPLAEAAERVGLTSKKLKEITGVAMFSHWFTKSQWTLIPFEHYKKIAEYYGDEWGADYETIKAEYDKIKKDYDRIKQDYYATRAFFDATHTNFNNVLHFNRTDAEEREDTGGHATPKPLNLVGLMLKTSTRKGDNVLDVFGGSGSTLIACEQLNRNCYMNELDPQYVDVIIRRWEKVSGDKAVKIN